jgi:uncharacterized membrane protein YccC
MAEAETRGWRRFPGSRFSTRAFQAAASRRAEFRHAARVCVAVAATFALTSLLHMQGFWAVFTAVIVVQASTGATLGAVRDRMIGTVLGGFVGALASFVPVTELWQRSGLLALTVAVLSFAAAVRPSLKVAPITAAIVMLGGATHLSPVHGAILRTVEVLLGSIVGVAAALLIFPQPARRAALERAARVMLVLKALLADLEGGLSGQTDRDAVQRSHVQIRSALAGIETVMTEATREQTARLGEAAPTAVLRTLWRVRNDTVLIDRALRAPLPENLAGELDTVTANMLRTAEAYLGACAEAATARSPLPHSDAELTAAHDRFEDEIEALRRQRFTSALSFDDAARVFGLIFAVQTLFANLIDLGERVDEARVRQARPSWSPLGWP